MSVPPLGLRKTRRLWPLVLMQSCDALEALGHRVERRPERKYLAGSACNCRSAAPFPPRRHVAGLK
jgi:hypothetical protein